MFTYLPPHGLTQKHARTFRAFTSHTGAPECVYLAESIPVPPAPDPWPLNIIIWSIHGREFVRAQELCESRGGRPGLPHPNIPYGLCGHKLSLKENTDHRSCVKVEVAVLVYPTLIFLMVSVDINYHWRRTQTTGAVWKSRWPSWSTPP